MKYFIECITIRRADCYGRASRREFWFFVLFLVLIFLVWGALVGALTYLVGAQDLSDADRIFREFRYPNADIALAAVALYAILIATAAPFIAVTIRRLHDIGKSGKWLLIQWFPVLGAACLLVLCLRRGDRGTNRFGEDPRTRYSSGALFKSDFMCMKVCLSKYADFANKCNLQEYWSFVILAFGFILLAGAIGGLLDLMAHSGGAAFSYSLTLIALIAFIVPLLSATARRLRNAGFRRRWIYAALIPFALWLPFAGDFNARSIGFFAVSVAGWLLLFVLLLFPDRELQEGPL